GDAGREPPEAPEQAGRPLGEGGGRDLGGVAGGELDDVGEADAVGEEDAVVLGAEGGDAERRPSGRAQDGAREGGPEAVRLAREVVAALDRVGARVDADEDEVEARGQ